MAQFESRQNEIKALGAELAYIAAEKRNGVWRPDRYLVKHPVSFPFLLDEDCAVTKAYGLHHSFAHDALNIARPATLVIDRSGNVRCIYRGDGQLDRAPLDEVINAVRNAG